LDTGLWVSLDEDDDDNNGVIRTFTPAAGGGSVNVSLPRDDDEQDFFGARAKLNFKFGTY
jgi:outer membrane immunogenic protein